MAPDDADPRDDLALARKFYRQRRWADAHEALARVDRAVALDAPDLEKLAWSAALCGRDPSFHAALQRVYQMRSDGSDFAGAASAAFWLGFHLLSLGEESRAAGWIGRASRLVEGIDGECAERGYLLLPRVHALLAAAQDEEASQLARQAAEIGERQRDADLVALSRNLQGRALIRLGSMGPGLALLDEAMVAAVSGELSGLVTGIVYCNAIATCQQTFVLDRAREWTASLARWCDAQPQLVTFTGHCLVHRSEILQLGGAWSEAIDQVRVVCDGAARNADPDVYGDARYQQAEMHRLRGELDAAERAYRIASRYGRDPQPGLALLRLAQSRTDAAKRALRRMMATTTTDWRRARLLPAVVEVMLAAGELGEAGRACEELERIAGSFGTVTYSAMAAQARGEVSQASGQHERAVEPLRHAYSVWRKLGAEYNAARVRATLGRVYSSLGDHDGADLEFDAARRVFAQLGAAVDLAQLSSSVAGPLAAGVRLSPRELQVLRSVAHGRTNKEIARELCLSNRTIDRHVSNILVKLDVPSRAAATAIAYENGLV